MIVKGLIWDEWNKEHIARHDVTVKEVEEVCQGDYKIVESYRKRILILGKTKAKRNIAIVLSPEDKSLKSYGNCIYYVITAYEKEVKK